MNKKKRLLYFYDTSRPENEHGRPIDTDHHPYPETRDGLVKRFRYWRGDWQGTLGGHDKIHIPWKGRTWIFEGDNTVVCFYPEGIPKGKP